MKALIIDQPGRTRIVDLPAPRIGLGEVLLRVRRVGLCGTDLNTFRGSNPLVTYPRVPGHEIAATIEGLGEDVPTSWSAGRDVLVMPYTSCGVCAACRRSRFNCCRDNQTLGVQRDGGMAEWLVAPWQKLITAEGLSPRELALVEPLSIGFHAVARGRVSAGETVVVIGCGMIGLGVIAAAAERQARVIAVDIDAGKLAIAAACGAAETVDSSSAALALHIATATSGEGPDVVIEAAGQPSMFRAAVELASFAGRVVYIGYAKAPVEYQPKDFVQKEIDVLGSRNALPEDFARVIECLRGGRFPIDRVITHSVPLAEAGAVLGRWNDRPREFVKIHVDFDATE